jgi:pSer/pThr/pTyr-binding forkhead associated (FHA) protein
MSLAGNLNTQPSIRLVIQKGPHAGQRFAFSKHKITIGRSPENDIILVNDPLISRQHAYIEINNNDVEIINLSVKNPILVNNENVNKWKLTNDTVFMIGDSEFLIQIEHQQSVVVVKPVVKASAPISTVLKIAPTHQSQVLSAKINTPPRVQSISAQQQIQKQMQQQQM